MKNLTVFLFLLLFSFPAFAANANFETASATNFYQDDYVVVWARSTDGKMIKVRYKLNPYTRKRDTFSGVQYYDNGSWNSAIVGNDDYGSYIIVFFTKYYFE
jgi:hypothetical protein